MGKQPQISCKNSITLNQYKLVAGTLQADFFFTAEQASRCNVYKSHIIWNPSN